MKKYKDNVWNYMHEKKTKKFGTVHVLQNETTYEVKEINQKGKVVRQYTPKEQL